MCRQFNNRRQNDKILKRLFVCVRYYITKWYTLQHTTTKTTTTTTTKKKHASICISVLLCDAVFTCTTSDVEKLCSCVDQFFLLSSLLFFSFFFLLLLAFDPVDKWKRKAAKKRREMKLDDKHRWNWAFEKGKKNHPHSHKQRAKKQKNMNSSAFWRNKYMIFTSLSVFFLALYSLGLVFDISIKVSACIVSQFITFSSIFVFSSYMLLYLCYSQCHIWSVCRLFFYFYFSFWCICAVLRITPNYWVRYMFSTTGYCA